MTSRCFRLGNLQTCDPCVAVSAEQGSVSVVFLNFQCQENSSCFLGGKRAVTKEIQSFIRAKQFVSIVLIKTSPRGSILVEGSLHRLARKSNQQSVRVRDVLHCP